MKIHIIPSWYPKFDGNFGGSFFKEQAQQLATHYPQHYFKVVVEEFYGIKEWIKNKITLQSSIIIKTKQVFNNLQEIHFSVLFLKRFFNTEKNTVKKIFEFLDEFKLNLIHAHAIWNGGYIAMELAKIIKYKYVITEHMGHFPWKIPLFINKKNQLTNRIKLPLENADALLAVSNSLADRIAQFNIKRPIVLYNLVNEQRFKPNNWPKTSLFNLLSIGRLTTQNGMDVLLHAFSNAYKSLPNLRLTILGDWKQKVELMHLIQKLAITNVVNLVGAVVRSKIIDYYHDAQCFMALLKNEWVIK
ncbi:MAG: glycosyltransferase [Burkholderiales bacterium]|nr:glycosyltransferase [Burkholderiales bacterium]